MMEPMLQEPSYAEKPPKPVAGALCLDFINTVTWRGDPVRRAERLTSYGELLIWSRLLGTLSAATERALRSAAARDAGAAARVLDDAIKLRHEMAHLFDPGLEARTKTPVLDRVTRDMGGIGRVIPGKGWTQLATKIDLRLPLLPIAVSALTLLTAPQRHQARSCADPQCRWLFLDETRNQSRLWCSMEDCGNRAKARAHYTRKTKGA